MKETQGGSPSGGEVPPLRPLLDGYEKKADAPSERSLCGHVDLSRRGMGDWSGLRPGGNGSGEARAALAKRMAFEAAMGHPCGTTYVAAAHLAPPGLRLDQAADARPCRLPLDPL